MDLLPRWSLCTMLPCKPAHMPNVCTLMLYGIFLKWLKKSLTLPSRKKLEYMFHWMNWRSSSTGTQNEMIIEKHKLIMLCCNKFMWWLISPWFYFHYPIAYQTITFNNNKSQRPYYSSYAALLTITTRARSCLLRHRKIDGCLDDWKLRKTAAICVRKMISIA